MTKHRERNADQFAEYRAWLARQPCMVCGAHGVQLAHVGVGGTGLKHGDDDQCVPLCGPNPILNFAGCHFGHDNTQGEFRRPRWLTKAQWRLVIQGWDEQAVIVCRAKFEARNVDTQGTVPF